MIIKCKMCGGDLTYTEGSTVCECEYCGSKQTLPKLTSDKKANLLDRAEHFRRGHDYDKAMSIYEQILNEDGADAEAYWGIVLCRYGIEYVQDPASGKRVPTINRMQYTSILADEDYKSALQYADADQRPIYEQEAAYIDSVQKGILAISANEKPYDVFICYKETDENGQRTHDSQDAQDIYYGLTEQGYKVFFSRITLEDKLGQQYEPYIFAALNSAKVMVVIGSKPEYFNAVWVKNEWSRYLTLMKNDRKRLLIPCYKGMDPYELPDALSSLQSQDMGKIGFMQDLLRGIRKVLDADKKPAQQVVVQSASSSEVTALLDRAFLSLEDGDWAKADDFCEKALNKDAKNSRAYLGKLMAEMHVRKTTDFATQLRQLDKSRNYANALRFADDDMKRQLEEYNAAGIRNAQLLHLRTESEKAMKALAGANTQTAVRTVRAGISGLERIKEVEEALHACDEKLETFNARDFDAANTLMRNGDYAKAAAAFKALSDYRDSAAAAQRCTELEAERAAKEAAEQAERNRINAERAAKEAAERQEKERVEAEKKARDDEIRRRENEAKADKNRKIGIIVAVVAVICVAAFFVVTKVVIPGSNYKSAVALLDEGKYDEASAAFAALGDYQDSVAQVKECAYRKATALADAGSYDEARQDFTALGEYKDSADMATRMTADALYDTGDYAGAYDVYATLGEAYQTHKNDYAAMYAAAEELHTAKSYDEAYNAYIALGNYSDSASKAAGIAREKADDLFAAGNYRDAANAYVQIGENDLANASTYAYAQQLADSGHEQEASAVWLSISEYMDSREKNYQLGLSLKDSDPTAACAILSADSTFEGAQDALYEIAVNAANAENYELAVSAYTAVGAYKDSTMKLQMATYAWGNQLYEAADYDRAAEVFASMGDFSDAADRVTASKYAAADAAMGAGNYDDAAARFETLGTYSDSADKVNAARYAAAKALLDAGNYADARASFEALGEYSDSAKQVNECDFRAAVALQESGSYSDAAAAFEALGNYASGTDTSAERAKECRYAQAGDAQGNGNYDAAIALYGALADYADSQTHLNECHYAKAQQLETKADYENAYAEYVLAGGQADAAAKAQEMAYQQGMEVMQDNNYEKAIEWFAKCVKYADTEAQLMTIGQYYFATQQYALAEKSFELLPENMEAQRRIYSLGQYYEMNNDYLSALRLYRKAELIDTSCEKTTLMTESVYQEAITAENNKDYDTAITVLESILDYKDSSTRIVEISNKAMMPYLTVGSYVTFGRYEQDCDTANGAEPIEWIVLEISEGKVLLLSHYGIDCMPYNEDSSIANKDICWQNSTLRSWMNNNFIYTAFTENEARCIVPTEVDNSAEQASDTTYAHAGENTVDKVFALSPVEAAKYYCSDALSYSERQKYSYRYTSATEYAVSRGARVWSSEEARNYSDGKGEGCCMYWCRTCTYAGGQFSYPYWTWSTADFTSSSFAVRPAMWIDITQLYPYGNYENVYNVASFHNVGSYVYFGSYEQDNNTSNGNEPIEWLVLDKEGNKSLLISRYCLDAQPYHSAFEEVTWENSSLRTWLNNNFLPEAFSDNENAMIILTEVDNSGNSEDEKNTEDKVFLLSYTEANKYFGLNWGDHYLEKAQVEPTAFAVAQGAKNSDRATYQTYDTKTSSWCYVSVEGITEWWLRSKSSSRGAHVVTSDGTPKSGIQVNSLAAIRPAIWVSTEFETLEEYINFNCYK